MAGRRQRRSVSSSSTGRRALGDNSRTVWIKESSILKPAPGDLPEDGWPIFVLTDATIYRKDGRTLANPLLVHIEGPLVIRGHLIIDDDEDDSLINPSLNSAHIEIPHSVTYSIGDPATLWVAGAAAWYEIRPSAEYKPVYDQVVEATNLYFSAFVAYEKHNTDSQGRKRSQRPSPPTFNQVLLKYAVKVGDGIIRDEVEALCHKWAEFLIYKFTREEDLVWDTTPFAKQMRDWYPEIHKRAIDAAKGLNVPPPSPPAPEVEQTQEPDQASVPQNRRGRHARASSRRSEVDSVMSRSRSPQSAHLSETGPRVTETPVPLPENYRRLTQPAPATIAAPAQNMPTNTSTSDAHSEAVDRLVAVLQEVAGETNINKAASSTILSKVYFRCKMRQPPKEVNYKSAVIDICSYYAKELLARLGPEWKGTDWHKWLQDAAATPWKPVLAIKPEDFPAQTFRRAKAVPKPASLATPATQLPPTINLKSKKAAQQDSEDESEEDAWVYTAPPGRRRSGKNATLTLASTSRKRPHSNLDDNGSRRGKKSAKLSHLDSDDEEAQDTSDDDIPAAIPVGSQLPLPEGTTRIVIRAERIPTTSPSGPDGTWTCEQEGCSYVVRSADDQDAQKLIQAHFRDHEAQAEKIDLAVKESRGHMPINHLLNKIQELGKAALFKKQAAVNGQPVPAPVKRRLLI